MNPGFEEMSGINLGNAQIDGFFRRQKSFSADLDS
jgi:hypothetical protein